MAIWDSIVSGAGSLLGGLFGLGAQSSANSTNMELAQYAFDRSVDMWRMQNAYNSPSQQMERLRAAGLNPNLVYGSGSVVGNNAGSPPSYNAPHINPVSNGGFVSDAVQHGLFTSKQLAQMDKSMALQDSQISVQDAQIAKTAAETASIVQNTARSRFDLDLAQELRKTSVETANANLQNMYSQINQRSIDAEYKKAEIALLPLKAKLSEAQYNNLIVATGRAAWELQQEKEGRFVGGDVWTQLANQFVRSSRGESSMLDIVKQPLNKMTSTLKSIIRGINPLNWFK